MRALLLRALEGSVRVFLLPAPWCGDEASACLQISPLSEVTPAPTASCSWEPPLPPLGALPRGGYWQDSLNHTASYRPRWPTGLVSASRHLAPVVLRWGSNSSTSLCTHHHVTLVITHVCWDSVGAWHCAQLFISFNPRKQGGEIGFISPLFR